MERMEIEAVTYIGLNLCIVVAGLTFLAIRPSAYAFTLAYVLGTGIGSASAIFMMRKEMRGIFRNFSWPLVRPLLATAAPFAASGVMGAFFINTDILVIGAMRSAADVGLYAAAQRIVQLLYLMPSILAVSLFPLMSRLANREDERFGHILERIFHIVYLIAIAIVVGGVIFGYQIITFIFGTGYAAAVPAFQVLLVTILADFPATIRSNVLFAYDRQKKLAVYAVVGGILNVVLDLVLIPRFGIVGSSWATLTAQIVSNTYLWYVMQQANPISVFPGLKRVALAAAGMGIFAWFLGTMGMQIIIAVILSGMFYAGLLLLLREPIFKELKFIFSPTET